MLLWDLHRLTSRNDIVRKKAASRLLANPSPRVVDAVTDLLQDKRSYVRQSSAEILFEVQDQVDREKLYRLLETDSGVGVWTDIADFLIRIRDKNIVQFLLSELSTGDASHHQSAGNLLAFRLKMACRAVRTLEDLAVRRDVENFVIPEVVDALFAALERHQIRPSQAIILSLALTLDYRCTPYLIEFVISDNIDVRERLSMVRRLEHILVEDIGSFSKSTLEDLAALPRKLDSPVGVSGLTTSGTGIGAQGAYGIELSGVIASASSELERRKTDPNAH